MSRNVADFRFTVNNEELGHSSVWRYWVTRHGDIYISSRNMARIAKLSFHRSGICRYAFTTEHGASSGINDRLVNRWLRPHIPHSESDTFARLAWLIFPTDYLSQSPLPGTQKVELIPSATSGMATFVEVGLCRHTEIKLIESIGSEVRGGITSYAPIFEDVAAFMRWSHGPWEIRDINVLASHGIPAYRFLANETSENARRIRIIMQTHPRDGDAIHILELGGCLDAT